MIKKITGLALSLSLLLPTMANAELYFDINALNLSEEEKSQLDLSLLMNTKVQMPGIYDVRIFVNKHEVSREKINFIVKDDQLLPDLSITQLERFGIKISAITALNTLAPDTLINDLSVYIDNASTLFNFENMSLDISIPQAFIDKKARGYVDVDKWDEGLPMLFTNYSYTGSKSSNKINHIDTTSHYINLRSGANLGAWRLRNYSYYQYESDGKATWRSMKTWLERDIKSLRARMAVGEINSSGLAFEGFSFKGVTLASQDEMLPDSLNGFAPTIHGVALTNATVEIRQKGNLIYQTHVPSGDFVIDDLYPTSAAGDLEVKIIEEDGSVRTFTQTFASAPIMVREGHFKYAFSFGRYETDAKNKFMQGEFIYGLSNSTTLYGGIIGAENYMSGIGGIGQGLGILGSVSLDVAYSKAKFINDIEKTGHSIRFRYSKSFTDIGTNMTLAGYRYSTKGFYDFDDANEFWANPHSAFYNAPKNRVQLSVNQQLGEMGNLSFSGYRQDYWSNSAGYQQNWSANWSKSFDGVFVNVGWNNNKNSINKSQDNIFTVGLNISLDHFFPSAQSASLNSSFTSAKGGSRAVSSTLSGSLLEDKRLSYSVTQSYNRQESGHSVNSSSVALNYDSAYGASNIKYSNYYNQSENLSWGLKSAIVVHPYGVTLAQNLPESGAAVLVKTNGASNIGISNTSNVRTDYFGYAIVPYVTSYRTSDIRLDTSTFADNVDITNTIVSVTPTRGALALANYQTFIGNKLFLTVTYNGQSLPLGTTLSNSDGVTGMVNERGEVYLSGVQGSEIFTATMLNGEICHINYQESHAVNSNGILMDDLACQ